MKTEIPSLPIGVISTGLHSLFWLFALIYLAVSAVLVYHWQKYGGKSKRVFIAETIYVIFSSLLLLTAYLFMPK